MFYENPQMESVNASNLVNLIPLYVADCARAGRAETTIVGYEVQLRPFAHWLTRYGPNFGYELTPERLENFAYWLEHHCLSRRGTPYTANSRALFQRRVNNLFKWAYRTGRTDRDISSWMPQIKQTPRQMRPIDVDGLHRMFVATALGQRRLAMRDACVLALMAGTGARRSEIAQILIEHITFNDDDYGTIHLHKTKNDKPRTVIFGPGTAHFLKAHLATVGRDHGRLFDVQPAAMWKIVDRLAERGNVGDIAPHDIRKFFAMFWMENGEGNDGWAKLCLQAQLGHCGADVTEKHYLFLTLTAGARSVCFANGGNSSIDGLTACSAAGIVGGQIPAAVICGCRVWGNQMQESNVRAILAARVNFWRKLHAASKTKQPKRWRAWLFCGRYQPCNARCYFATSESYTMPLPFAKKQRPLVSAQLRGISTMSDDQTLNRTTVTMNFHGRREIISIENEQVETLCRHLDAIISRLQAGWDEPFQYELELLNAGKATVVIQRDGTVLGSVGINQRANRTKLFLEWLPEQANLFYQIMLRLNSEYDLGLAQLIIRSDEELARLGSLEEIASRTPKQSEVAEALDDPSERKHGAIVKR